MADTLKSTAVERPAPRYKIFKIIFVAIIGLTMAVVLVLLGTTRSSTFMTVKISTIVNLTKNQSVKLLSFAFNRTGYKPNMNATQGSVNIKLYRNSTRVSVVFMDMPDPCIKPRRNTGTEDLLCMVGSRLKRVFVLNFLNNLPKRQNIRLVHFERICSSRSLTL